MQSLYDRILFEKRENSFFLNSVEMYIADAGFRQFVNENPLYSIDLDAESKLRLYREQWDAQMEKKVGFVSLALQKLVEKRRREGVWLDEFSKLIGFIERKKTKEEWIASYGLKVEGETLSDIAKGNSVSIVLIVFGVETEYETFGDGERVVILAIHNDEFIGKRYQQVVDWEHAE